MDPELVVYGFLAAVGILAVAWFALILPSERRDHERRLELIRKRLAEREQRADGPAGDERDGN